MNEIPYRIGLGHDTHRLEKGRRLILGGVEIPHHVGLAGHSDADVLLHAITDAILGALGQGDIGEAFPNTDVQYEGADSAIFLQHAVRLMQEGGWQVGNLDCTIFAQQPKLKAFKPAIRKRVAQLLSVSEECVNIKAKTGEHVGAVGREESMDASAVVLLARSV